MWQLQYSDILFDQKRPYVVYDFTPLIVKEKKGQSMPSRHVFSAFVIAMSALYICIPLGIFMMLLAVIMAFERVICGVHFPKDVIGRGSYRNCIRNNWILFNLTITLSKGFIPSVQHEWITLGQAKG